MTKYSEPMKAYMDAQGISPKQVLYLTIAQVHLRRIVAGTKTVDFRDFTDFYMSKLFVIEDNVSVGLKPYTHILFQGGYSATSPRAPVQLLDAKCKPARVIEPTLEVCKLMAKEAAVEGFAPDDEWIGIALGKVEFVEGF